MKPFFFLLILIASGLLIATSFRPFTMLTEALRKLIHMAGRPKTTRPLTSQAITATPSACPRRKRSLSGESWRPAAQF